MLDLWHGDRAAKVGSHIRVAPDRRYAMAEHAAAGRARTDVETPHWRARALPGRFGVEIRTGAGEAHRATRDELALVGTCLARVRSARGLSIREIARRTQIADRHLSAIERSDFASLPAPVFVKGFVRAYAEALGLDAVRLVAAVDFELRVAESQSAPEPRTATRRWPWLREHW